MKIVYSYYVLDLVHKGHLKMMENAKAIAGKDGKLIVGILTDEAVMEKKSKPIISFDERFDLANAIKYVDLVVACCSSKNLFTTAKCEKDQTRYFNGKYKSYR